MEECKNNNCHQQEHCCCHTGCQCANNQHANSPHDEHCEMAEEILHLAKCAKHHLLKEKMKVIFEDKIGKKLDKIAEAAVDALLAKMEHKKTEKQGCEQYREKLMAAITD